jgi:hypothetical protein
MPTSASPANRNRRLFELTRAAGVAIPASLPELSGDRVKVFFRPSLTTHRGQLLSGSDQGTAVHAAAFLRRREIILDELLLRTPGRLARIFVHEVFHFAWLHLGNEKRHSYEALLQAEMQRGARGELGWTAESMKRDLTHSDRTTRSQKWRHYACESFCDTAGWAFGGSPRYAEMTLARQFRKGRMRWFTSIADIIKV